MVVEIGVPDAEFGEFVAAIVAFCRVQLSYKKPKHVRFVDALPRNALGKVRKHLLQ